MRAPDWASDGIALYLGDARELLPTIDLSGIAVVLGDPPYGITAASGYAGRWVGVGCVGDADTSTRDETLELLQHLPALVFGSPRVPRPARTRHVLTWDKGGHTGMGDLSFPWRADTDEVYVLGDGWPAVRRRSSVLRHMAITGLVEVAQGRSHPFEKPVALLQELLRACPPGGVLDPWMGSGSTALAAYRERRPFVGIEIAPEHFETACRRVAEEIGGAPLFASRDAPSRTPGDA